MRVDLINLYAGKLHLFKEVQQQFNQAYPFLKIEFMLPPKDTWTRGLPKQDKRQEAADLLREIGLGNQMTVDQFERALLGMFGAPAQVYRKSLNNWIETRMTRDWSLLKQNDLGREIQAGFQSPACLPKLS